MDKEYKGILCIILVTFWVIWNYFRIKKWKIYWSSMKTMELKDYLESRSKIKSLLFPSETSRLRKVKWLGQVSQSVSNTIITRNKDFLKIEVKFT